MAQQLDPETARRMREDGACTWCERFPVVHTNVGPKCAGCARVVGDCRCSEVA